MGRRDDAGARLRTAARTLFLEHGFERTSTAAICREARVSKETLYARYPTKDLLFADVLEHLIVSTLPPTMTEEAWREPPTVSLRDELRRFARAVTGVMMHPDYVGLFRLVVAETPRQPLIAERLKALAPHRGLAAVERILERHGVTDVDTDAASRLFMGPLLTYLLIDGVFSVEAPRAPDEARLDAHVDLFLRALGP